MTDFFDLSPDPAAILTAGGRFDAVNQGWTAVLGWGQPGLNNQAFSDLVHPEDRASLNALLVSLTADHPHIRSCARLQRADGDWLPLDLSLRKCPDTARIAITARQVTPDHARLRMAIESLPDGFILYDAENRLLTCNTQFREFFAPIAPILHPGARLEDVLHAMIAERVFPDSDARPAQWFEHYAKPPPDAGVDYELRFHGDRWLRINERRTPEGGRVALCIDITATVNSRNRIKHAEAAAHAARERLTAAIEALEDGFVLFDAEDRLILCNQRYRQMHAPISDLIRPGVHYGDILRAGLKQQIFSEAIGMEDAWYAHTIDAPPPKGHEMEVGLSDGRWLRVVERPTPEGGRVGLRIDITHQVESRQRAERAEADARSARERLSAAIEALEDGFVLFDAEDRLVMCNRKYREFYRMAASVMQPGTSFETILRTSAERGEIADAVGRVEAWLETRLGQHRAGTGQFEQHLSDGRVLRIHETQTADGGRVGLRVDVTELHQARQRAEAANRAKSDFLSNMSHEIRTPMNAVLGMADLLAETSLNADQQDMLNTIRESGWSLLSLINDILDLARVEAGKLTLDEEPFIPADLIDSIIALHQANARSKTVTLCVDQTPQTSLARLGDASRIAQILHNVIGNAVKFTEQGEIRMTVDASSPDAITFRIDDTGIGMTEEQLARVFDPFEQAEAGTTRRFGGTGLGMSIVKRLVQMMKGEVTVKSALSQGTSITIRLGLPLSEEPRKRASVTEPTSGSGAIGLADCRLLVVDDNAANRKILAAYLDKLQLTAEFAVNGAEACALWQKAEFDLILMDISMPVMGGVEALAEMLKRSKATGRPSPRVIAVTANVMHEQVAQYRAQGFIDIIHKPIRFSELQAILRRHTSRSPSRLSV